MPIDAERREANRIKAAQPILAIIGNPPYKGLRGNERETLVGRWMAGGRDEGGNVVAGIWDDLKQPVKDAGKGNQLNAFEEFSIAFWRWAIWKLFEGQNPPGRGIVAYITNRTFLTGWPYAGLRKMMRERFDRIEIIDLRGDVRTGTRGDVESDEGVFDIMVGTAITIAIADGSKAAGTLADVTYVDSWAENLFARRAKLAWLAGAADAGVMADALDVDRNDLDDFRPTPFQSGEWLSLREIFTFSKSGMKSGSNETFIRVMRRGLEAAMAVKLAEMPDAVHDHSLETEYVFAALDRRWFYNDLNLLQRPGPDLQRAWGAHNAGLQALKSGTGNGPAVWCNALLPDYDSFNRRGGYAFPLYDRRRGPDATNLSPILLEHLAEAYGQPVTAADVFDAILTLLSATSYTRRFAEDLEDVFPHIPFPAEHAVLMRAVAVGREIRAVETFARAPMRQPTAFFRLATQPAPGVVVGTVACREGIIDLCPDGRGRITGIPDAIWSFAVSGYRVLPRWIEGRKGLPADLSFIRELRDVALRIAELIHRFDEADLVLNDTLADTLTRAELGFPAPVEGGDAADDD